MAARGTVPESLATRVDEIVGKISVTAKLRGLASLVEELRAEQPDRWRLVVFTTRRETQTTIVIASLAGKDVDSATKLAEKSIAEAKVELQNQEKTIDAMFGKVEDAA